MAHLTAASPSGLGSRLCLDPFWSLANSLDDFCRSSRPQLTLQLKKGFSSEDCSPPFSSQQPFSQETVLPPGDKLLNREGFSCIEAKSPMQLQFLRSPPASLASAQLGKQQVHPGEHNESWQSCRAPTWGWAVHRLGGLCPALNLLSSSLWTRLPVSQQGQRAQQVLSAVWRAVTKPSVPISADCSSTASSPEPAPREISLCLTGIHHLNTKLEELYLPL